ncbi:MAG: hypothetical protein KJ900_08830 [Proteobacteria bacterium]|nr:hypothetical protein [Desulfocapsa sp.]MBU3944395.1 hypothetical protein [Pseudomonadota bacterium]MCG2743122.1 hypothetical protein [Desulfobacteraceae bacterium]MBU3984742.1 hypothetical protein [Pseudomonadota bacterium]MBU4028526.1 hypothetical protein [Pseudomonadota bacterium]
MIITTTVFEGATCPKGQIQEKQDRDEVVEKTSIAIHQTRKFSKRMACMARAGKNERIVADRAKQILIDLQTNPLHEGAECKRTRHGELRLNDCRKYDLSCGFRLIALKRDNRLIFTYIGSHDDCQRWIENNRDYQDVIESTPVPLMSIKDHQRDDMEARREQPDNYDEYEERLMEEIDEHLLHTIFAGFCKKA